MAASTKRTIRTLAILALALCLTVPLAACAYNALATTGGDENAEAAATPAKDASTAGEGKTPMDGDADASASNASEADESPAQQESASDGEAAGTTEADNKTTDNEATNQDVDTEARNDKIQENNNAKTEADDTNEDGKATANSDGEPKHQESSKAEEANKAAATTATIMYYENVGYEDGDVKPDEEGHVLLGTYELTGVHVGQTLNAWDYVVDIPGFFFWDGWPQKITLTENASDNVIKLFYFKLWNNEYTVNYYLMENADLTADNWKDALAPDDVKFVKMGSETFTDQRFDKLVKGDAYEYKIDGTYVVDTYPSEIRVGVNPDDNVINVLYVPDSATLPDDIEIPDNITPAEGETSPDTGDQPDGATQPGTNGDSDGSLDKPTDIPDADKPLATPDAIENGTPNLPSDTTFDKNEIEEVLPDNVKDEVVEDFIESGEDQDKVEITDEMIENPVSKSDVDYVKSVYETGLKEGEKLAQTGDLVPFAIVASIALGAAVAGVIAFTMNRRAKR